LEVYIEYILENALQKFYESSTKTLIKMKYYYPMSSAIYQEIEFDR